MARYRWRALEATFLGYAFYYLVRNNVPVVVTEMRETLGYSREMIGNIGAVTALSYGLSKFLMGSVSDRSDPRRFMSIGLALTALCNFAFGASSSYSVHLWLWGLNGFFQGMGWPPCGRVMGHWFSESERGLTFSIWNTSHNFGGGIAGVLAAWAVQTLAAGSTHFTSRESSHSLGPSICTCASAIRPNRSGCRRSKNFETTSPRAACPKSNSSANLATASYSSIKSCSTRLSGCSQLPISSPTSRATP